MISMNSPALKIIFILISSSSSSSSGFANFMRNKKITKMLNNKKKMSMTKTILT